jgi:hypothetical protein
LHGRMSAQLREQKRNLRAVCFRLSIPHEQLLHLNIITIRNDCDIESIWRLTNYVHARK